MSTIKVNAITDASGGNTATINSMTPTADSLQGFRNRIINGDMRIDQRNAGASVTLTSGGVYPVDRFIGAEDSDGTMTAQRDSSAPTGFVNSVKFTTTTADASLGATQYALVVQYIEGTNVADLAWGTANAKTITLSFWVRSSLTGTFGGSLRNSAANRSYPFTYSISVADTWEQKSVTITGDTTGTWLTTTGVGIGVIFGLGVGSTYSGTAGAWAASNLLSATGATSVIGTLNATWYVTGVQFEVGSVATPFERRDYGRELMMCQRYYYKIFPNAVTKNLTTSGNSASSTTGQFMGTFPVTMRIAPTALEQSGTANQYNIQEPGINGTACSGVPTFVSQTTDSSYYISGTVSSGLTLGRFALLRTDTTNGANAYLAWSAEL